MRKAISAGAKSGSACSTMHPRDSNVLRCPSTTARTRGSKGTPPRSLNHATRTPLKLRSSGRAQRSAASSMESGAGIWPRDRTQHEGQVGHRTPQASLSTQRRPRERRFRIGDASDGRSKATTLQNAAGLRSDPPVSEPLAIGIKPQANATAAPPENPPQVFVTS
jgi:hypothetical protein